MPTLAITNGSIYRPNNIDVNFFNQLSDRVDAFNSDFVVLGGNWTLLSIPEIAGSIMILLTLSTFLVYASRFGSMNCAENVRFLILIAIFSTPTNRNLLMSCSPQLKQIDPDKIFS
jgi:hypothetical protein